MNWRTLLIIGLLIALPASAQDPADNTRVVYQFELTAPDGPFYLSSVPSGIEVPLQYLDLSRDNPNGIDPSLPRITAQSHKVSFTAAFEGNPPGWGVANIPSFASHGGEMDTPLVRVSVTPKVEDTIAVLNVTAHISTSGGDFTRGVLLEFRTLGVSTYQASFRGNFDGMQGNEVRQGTLILTNQNLAPKTFQIRIERNQCDLDVATLGQVVLTGRQRMEISVNVRGPDQFFYSSSRDCSMKLVVTPIDGTMQPRTLSMTISFSDIYINPEWVIWTVFIGIILLALFAFAAARKRRIDEEILGKPQKPWLIPVEKLYLEKLREKDERAWYVVRHHLMQEEYQSAMDWYKDYRKGTKGSRKKERVILRYEHRFERWQSRVEGRLARPSAKAARFRARLQRKLDRKSRRQTIQVRSKADKRNKQIQAAFDKKLARATEKWQKVAAKAAKKGKEQPPQPQMDAPELLVRPDAVSIELAQHKWAKKAEKMDLKMDKVHLKLQNKIHKEERKQVAKLRRKIERIGRKLKDPEFLAEHGLA